MAPSGPPRFTEGVSKIQEKNGVSPGELGKPILPSAKQTQIEQPLEVEKPAEAEASSTEQIEEATSVEASHEAETTDPSDHEPQVRSAINEAPQDNKGLLIGALVVGGIFLLGIFTFAITALLGGGGDQVVLEPRANGDVDVHLTGLGDELSRDTEALSRVDLRGEFFDFQEDGSAISSDVGYSFDGGQLIGFVESGDSEIQLALLKNGETQEIVDGDGALDVYRGDFGVVAMFSSDRCSVELISGEGSERVARGDQCQVRGNFAFEMDNGEFSAVDLRNQNRIEFGDFDSFPRISSNGNLVVLSEDDRVRLIEMSSPETSEEIRLDDLEALSVVGQAGIYIINNTTDDLGLAYVSAEDGSRVELLEGEEDAFRVVASPTGAGVIIVQPDDADDPESDITVFAGEEGASELTVAGEFVGQQLLEWRDSTNAAFIDVDGVVFSISLDGDVEEIDELDNFDSDDHSITGVQRTDDGDLLISADAQTNDPDLHWFLEANNDLSSAIEASEISVWFGLDTDREVFGLREDPADREVQMAAFDGDDLVNFDEADSLGPVFFDGGNVAYMAIDGGDIETRSYSLGSSHEPETIYDDAIAIRFESGASVRLGG